MRKTRPVRLLLLLVVASFACEGLQSDGGSRGILKFRLVNDLNMERNDELVTLSVTDLKEQFSGFDPEAFAVLESETGLACQSDDLDGDGELDQVSFVANFGANGEKEITLRNYLEGEEHPAFKKRTQAEISHKFDGHFAERKYIAGEFRNVGFVRVPAEHTDHSFFFRYEGPGWESDKVGYRYYLDWRNAIDIFGKKTPEMVLQNVGLDNFDSYHEMSDWGMDILKVGESLGLGSIGTFHDGKVVRVSETDSTSCEIVANGPVYSQIRTNYNGWKIGPGKHDLVSNLAISAGSRLTKHTVTIAGEIENLCTGLVKHEATEVLQADAPNGDWQYFALFGKQSLAEDELGMAIIFRESDLSEIVEDDLSHVIVLTPRKGELTYYFLAAWAQEPGGIKSKGEFQQYLAATTSRLNSPITVRSNDK